MSSQFIGVFSIGTTLDRGLRLYKRALKRIFPLLLLPMMIGMLPYVQNRGSLYSTGFSGTETVFFIINVLVGIWAWVVCFRYMQKISLGENPSISEMLKLAGPGDYLLIFTYLLWALMFFAGSVALLVPGIYVLNLFLMGPLVATIERKFLFSGIARTFHLTRKRWWKTFAINFIASIIVFVPSIIGISIMGITSVMGTGSVDSVIPGTQPSSPGFIALIGFAVYCLILALVFPVLSSILLVHYNSLRCEKENLDLVTTINQIG